MTIIREITGAILFIIAVGLTIYICTNIFSWAFLIIAIVCYLAAYWIWPSKKDGQREESYLLLDIIEILIDLPFRIILWLLRFLKNSDGTGVDL